MAVVGAGLAGLCAAWLLGRVHRVTLFERQPQPGFTAGSLTVPGPLGAAPQRVDVPLRVYYPGYYPTLARLYRALGVATQPVSYAGTFWSEDGQPYFRYRNLRWGPWSWGVLAPQDGFPGRRARAIVAGWWRFRRLARAAQAAGLLAGVTLGDFLRAQRLPPAFIDGFLLPTMATVCTCSYRQVLDCPAAVIVDYLAAGVQRQAVHRVLHGADEVQRRLLAGVADLRCGARIGAVRCRGDAVELCLDDGPVAFFDHVVFATPAHAARRLLVEARADESAVLDAFRQVPVDVVTHSDARLMPPRRRDWSPVNLRVVAGEAAPEATIWVNAVQPALRGAADVFQTVQPARAPAAAMVLGQARFDRPVVDAASEQALAGLQRLHAEAGRRLWFCGAYAQSGIPLLESACRSAWQVAGQLGAPLPD